MYLLWSLTSSEPASFYSYSFISFLLIIHLYHLFSLLLYIGRRFVLVFNGAEKGRVRKSAKLHFKKLHVNCVSNVFGQRRLTIFYEHMNNVRFHNFSKWQVTISMMGQWLWDIFPGQWGQILCSSVIKKCANGHKEKISRIRGSI